MIPILKDLQEKQSPTELGVIHQLLQEDVMLGLRGFVYDLIQQREYEEYLQQEELITASIAQYRTYLYTILTSKDSDELQINIVNAILPTLEIVSSSSNFLKFIGADLLKSYLKGFDTITQSIGNKENEFGKSSSQLMIEMHRISLDTWQKHLEYTKLVSALALESSVYVPESATSEELLSHAVDYIQKQKKKILEFLLTSPENLNTVDDIGRRMILSSLAFQAGMLAILEILHNESLMISKGIFIELVKKTHILCISYKKYTDIFWHDYFTRAFINQVKQFSFVRNIHIDNLSNTGQILVDIQDTTSKENLFHLYDVEKKILNNIEHPPIVKFYREPSIILPHLKSV